MKRILAAIVILAVAKGLAGLIVKKYRPTNRPRPYTVRSIRRVDVGVLPPAVVRDAQVPCAQLTQV